MNPDLRSEITATHAEAQNFRSICTHNLSSQVREKPWIDFQKFLRDKDNQSNLFFHFSICYCHMILK